MADLSLFERHYEVTSFLVNPQRKLGLYPFLNLLQDAASTHADALGFGYKDMVEKGTFWVLSRQKAVMTNWPHWHEQITIKTWIRYGGGPFSNRDFLIYLNDQKIGEATTTWVALDKVSRKPVNIDRSSVFENVQDLGKTSFEATKISRQPNLEEMSSFSVRISDLDQNLHVNNTKYAQWILDAIPLSWHSQFELTSYSVNFLAETFLNDTITIFMGVAIPVDGVVYESHYEGVRQADGKCVFTARLEYKNKSS